MILLKIIKFVTGFWPVSNVSDVNISVGLFFFFLKDG
jgi:lipoprotein signal peptidase